MNKFTRFETFISDLAAGVHDLATGELRLALTNMRPDEGRVLADITEIGYQQCSDRGLSSTLVRKGSGIRLSIDDLTLTASGVVGPFRYFVVYNASAANKEMIGWSDYGRSVTLEKDDRITVKFDQAKGVLEIS